MVVLVGMRARVRLDLDSVLTRHDTSVSDRLLLLHQDLQVLASVQPTIFALVTF